MVRKIKQQTHHGYLAGIGASGGLLACALIVLLSLIGTVSVNVWPESTGPGAPAIVELQSPAGGSHLSDAEGLIASTEGIPPASSGGHDNGGSGGPGGGTPPQAPVTPPDGGSTPPNEGTQVPQGGDEPGQPAEEPASGGGPQQGRDESGPGEQHHSQFGDCDAGLSGDGDTPDAPDSPVGDEGLGDGHWDHGGDRRDFEMGEINWEENGEPGNGS